MALDPIRLDGQGSAWAGPDRTVLDMGVIEAEKDHRSEISVQRSRPRALSSRRRQPQTDSAVTRPVMCGAALAK